MAGKKGRSGGWNKKYGYSKNHSVANVGGLAPQIEAKEKSKGGRPKKIDLIQDKKEFQRLLEEGGKVALATLTLYASGKDHSGQALHPQYVKGAADTLLHKVIANKVEDSGDMSQAPSFSRVDYLE